MVLTSPEPLLGCDFLALAYPSVQYNLLPIFQKVNTILATDELFATWLGMSMLVRFYRHSSGWEREGVRLCFVYHPEWKAPPGRLRVLLSKA